MGLSQCFGSSAASLKESPSFFKRFPDSLKEFLSALKELRARSRPQQMARASGLRPFRPGKRFKEVLDRIVYEKA